MLQSPRSKFFGLIGLLLAITLGWFALRSSSATSGELLTAVVEKGELRRTVSATGTMKAVITVQVGSQVTGVIQSLGADYNAVVKEGQVIAQIDPATFAAQLQRSEADLTSAVAQSHASAAALLNQKANRTATAANLEGAAASRDEKVRLLERSTELAHKGYLSERELESAQSVAAEARARVAALAAQLQQNDAQIVSAQASIEEAKSRIAQATAAVTLSRVNLEHATITSPIDGVVISRNVDVGQTVAASLSAPTLFVIANDLRQMNVIANIDEADIGSISQATKVSFTVDAFPGETFTGTIRQVRLEPLTQQNVVTYSVIVDVDNRELKLRPGMTANVTMSVSEASDVLKVANAALRFWPADVPRSKAEEILGPKQPEATVTMTNDPSPQPAAAAAASPAVEGLSAEANALLTKMKDPSLPQEERRALFGKMRELPEGERARLRAAFGGGGGGFGGAGGERRRERALGGGGSTATGELLFPPPPPPQPSPRIVWVLNAGNLEPRRVMVTITDGSVSAVVAGDLKEGETVVTGQAIAGSGPPKTTNPFQPASPFGGGRGGGGGGRR